jgi:CheY-like chemotaxis protein
VASELILLVDDIPDHAERYEAVLIREGFRVVHVRTGEEALSITRQSLPECAIIDVRLPDMSGWDLCREIKGRQQASTRIIVLTPDVSAMCAADSAKAGCHAWLSHPTVADDLARTVKQVLQLDSDQPASLEASLLGLKECPACGKETIRATLRVGVIQWYCCRSCSFCWRVEAFASENRPS